MIDGVIYASSPREGGVGGGWSALSGTFWQRIGGSDSRYV